MSAQSLRRHRRNCKNDVIMSNEIENDEDEDVEEGVSIN